MVKPNEYIDGLAGSYVDVAHLYQFRYGIKILDI
jgi:hypothetical protein